jgi:hypothetical protein
VADPLPHPTAISRPKPEIQRDFIAIEQTRCSDSIWHFKVGLPHGCVIGPDGEEPPDDDTPRSLGLFHREGPPADIEVIGVVALREVDPADYLDCMLELEEKTVVSRRPVPMRGGIVGDAVATWKADDKPFAGRFFCTKWGPRIFVLCMRTPEEHYAKLAEDFFVSIATFSVLDDSLGLLAEKVQTVSNTVPVPWRVIVPESWVIKPEPNGDDRVASFQATQVPVVPSAELEVLYGKLSFAVVARSEAKTGRAAANAYLSAVRDLGIVIENQEFLEEKATDPFEKSWILVTNVQKNGHPGELRCRVLMHKKAWVIAGVLGPVRKDSALAWMQNKRILDIVTSTLKVKS